MRAKKATNQHLNSITAENLLKFQANAYVSMASSVSGYGNFSIGINGFSKYVVKANENVYVFNTPDAAILQYKKMVSGEQD